MWTSGGSPSPNPAVEPGLVPAAVPFCATAALPPEAGPFLSTAAVPPFGLSECPAASCPAPTPVCLLAGLPLPASEDACDWPGASESEEALRPTLFAKGIAALSFACVSDSDTTRAGVGSATGFDAV